MTICLLRMSVQITYGDRVMSTGCPGYDLTWDVFRQPLIDFAWVEMYAGQKAEWVALMDNPKNLSSRVWIHPFEPVLELRYERYDGDTYHLKYGSSFIVVANFDAFFRYWPDCETVRMETLAD